MNDEQYRIYNLSLLDGFADDLSTRTRTLDEDDPLRQLAIEFQHVQDHSDELYPRALTLVSRLFNTYPDIAPLFLREVLWFLGGDCLHFMPDEEIEQFQKLEEQRETAAGQGETFDMRTARAKLLNLQ